MAYVKVPDGFDLSSEFDTYIIGFCPDPAEWFVTNQRFFSYEYPMEFQTEEEGINYFKLNAKKFYDIEIKMGIYRPSFLENKVWLSNIEEEIEVGKE